MDPRIRKLLEDRILTTRELSERTGIPEVTIKKRVERRQIQCVKKGRTFLFDSADFPVRPPLSREQASVKRAALSRRAGTDDDDAGPSRGEGS